MVQYIKENLMSAGKLAGINGVVIHNDAGSKSAEWYVNWLKGREKSLGIAHYYIDRHTIARVIDTDQIGYHTGEWHSNTHYIGYEVCQSVSASDEDFLANEDMTLMQATEDMIYYGLPINTETVRLHHEFVPTSCPHRSMALHGNDTEAVKQYFVGRMRYFASLGKTVAEMIEKTQKVHQSNQKNEEKGDEDMSMTFIRAEEALSPTIPAGAIFLINAGARTYKHLTPVQYDSAKAAYPNAVMLKATKRANYLVGLTQAIGAKAI